MTLSTPLSDVNRSLKLYATRLEKLGVATVEDFLYYIPFRYDNFSLISKISDIQPGEVVTIQAQVEEIGNIFTRSYKKIQKAVLRDDTGSLEVTWFNQPFLTKYIHAGDTVSVSGKIDTFGNKIVLQSPEYEIITNGQKPLHTGRLVPIYSETRGVSSKWIRRQIFGLLESYTELLSDYLPEEIRKSEQLLTLQDAIQTVHFPETLADAEAARKRLAFDELFLMQLRAKERRKVWDENIHGTALQIEQGQITAFVKSLPFSLTTSQQQAVDAILEDLKRPKPMNRMLQGDVGSGKTVVGSVALLAAHLNGFQSAFMAPTEILATQHFQTLKTFLIPFGINVELVTGSKKLAKDTSFDVLVGTHALLSKNVQFEKLGLVIIDEQQRFGVEQRGIMRQKGNNPHILTMTATPIPRTIALTMYGDLDVSYLTEMPRGRKLIKTWLVPDEKREGAYEWIRKEIQSNSSQAFVICPLIEDSENMITVKAASSEYERLQKEVFPDLKLSLLHGRMKAKEKDTVLSDFKAKKAHILVATPVVEVGIDIPNATIILIEAAERFGLSQLHQLRGRVGRGDKQSYCLLFTESLSELTQTRLKAMESSHVGAELAELDLRLRGPGDLFGTAQHGQARLKVASFSDFALIERAKAEADHIFPKLGKYKELEKLVAEQAESNVSPD